MATDLLCSDNLPIYNQNWKNGTTYQITGKHIHSISAEAQWLGIKKVGNIPVITHLKQADEDPLSKLNQCSDTTFKNREANNQKQPIWTGLKKHPKVLQRIMLQKKQNIRQ